MAEISSVLAGMPDGRLERILRDLPTGASTRSSTSRAATTERRTREERVLLDIIEGERCRTIVFPGGRGFLDYQVFEDQQAAAASARLLLGAGLELAT